MEMHQGQGSYLSFPNMVDMEVKTLIQHLVCVFTGTVCLWIEGSGQLELDNCQLVEGSPEARYGQLISIGHNLQWQTIFSISMFKKEHGKFFCHNICMSGDNTNVSASPVCEHHNGIETMLLWHGPYKIDGHTVSVILEAGQQI